LCQSGEIVLRVHRLTCGSRLPATAIAASYADWHDEHVGVGQVAGIELRLSGVVIAEDPQQPSAHGHRPEPAALGVVVGARDALAEDADRPPVEVDVVPAQRERLAVRPSAAG
jgi:hypothetical protein